MIIIDDSDIVPLRWEQVEPAGQLLARAFDDDPMSVYLVPDAGRRRRALTAMMTATVRYGLANGEVYATGGDLRAVAAWLPPGRYPMGWLSMTRSGMVGAALQFGPGGIRRLLRFMTFTEHLHERYCPSPHWYLGLLGVDPPDQGKGIGSRLIRPTLARATEAGSLCYLETTNPRNLHFYEKQGFQTLFADPLPADGPRCWAMLRNPRSQIA